MNNIQNRNLIFPGQQIFVASSDSAVTIPNSCGKVVYEIKRGDTLSSLAIQYRSTVQEIATLNNISNPNLIYAGAIIRIPTCR